MKKKKNEEKKRGGGFLLTFTAVEGNRKCDAGTPEAPGAAAGLPELKSHTYQPLKDDMALKNIKC